MCLPAPQRSSRMWTRWCHYALKILPRLPLHLRSHFLPLLTCSCFLMSSPLLSSLTPTFPPCFSHWLLNCSKLVSSRHSAWVSSDFSKAKPILVKCNLNVTSSGPFSDHPFKADVCSLWHYSLLLHPDDFPQASSNICWSSVQMLPTSLVKPSMFYPRKTLALPLDFTAFE